MVLGTGTRHWAPLMGNPQRQNHGWACVPVGQSQLGQCNQGNWGSLTGRYWDVVVG